MKRWWVLVLILGASGAGLYLARRQKDAARTSPEAVLNALAETQREISRVPARLTRLSDDEEIRVGDGMAENYVAGLHRSSSDKNDAEMESYIAEVGHTVSEHARRRLEYRFHYISQEGLVNAFSLPGGHVFIGKGLVTLLTSEDELANVLGHEVEHIDNYHCNERVALRHQPLGELLALPVELFQKGYSKEQELEADRDGASLAVQAGYSPQGANRSLPDIRAARAPVWPAGRAPRPKPQRRAFTDRDGRHSRVFPLAPASRRARGADQADHDVGELAAAGGEGVAKTPMTKNLVIAPDPVIG